MQISVEEHGKATVVKLAGHMGHVSIDEFNRVLEECLARGARDIVLDMGRMDYISSAGLRCLFNLVTQVNNLKGKLILCSMQPEVRQVFDVSGFTSFFSISDSLSAALKQI